MSKPAAPCTVLIVEDDQRLRSVLARALRLHGYDVLTASDGVEALSILQREGSHITVVVLDVVMPNMGGLAVMRHLLNIHTHAVGFVGMSGYSEIIRSTDDFFSLSSELILPRRFLPKPFGLTEFLRDVEATAGEIEKKRRKHNDVALGDAAQHLRKLESRLEGIERRIPNFLTQLGLNVLSIVVIGLAVVAVLYFGIGDLIRSILGL